MKIGLLALSGMMIFSICGHAAVDVAAIQAACPGYTADKNEASLQRFNPAAATLFNVKLPANNQILYRGAYDANTQFDLIHAMRGLFDDKDWFVGSPLFWGISEVLKKKWSLDQPFLPTGGLPLEMRSYFEVRKILPDVERLLKCAPPKGFSTNLANEMAADLMNKSFRRMQGVESNFLDLKNPIYYAADFQNAGLGNNAVDFVISSAYDQIAGLYGRKILVTKDRQKRGVDLGYWNYVHNKVFWTDWVDNGEVDVPGYVQADDLLGYQQRKVDRPRAGWGSYYENPIDYAVYKEVVNGRTYVLAFDAADAPCMVKAGDKYYRCENNWSKIADGIIPYPTASAATHRNQIALMGAFLLCDDNDAACAVDDSFWSAYGKSSDRQIPAAVMKEILALKINGKSLKYFAAKATAEDQDDFDGMKVISATFLKPSERSAKNDGNVTKSAAAFLNGKSAEVYKISSAFLHVPYDKAAREFELKWVCPDAPKKVLTKKVAAPAEGTKISVGCP